MAKHKGGRPSKLGKIDLRQVESLAALGLTDEDIALVLGIGERTLERYKKDPDFWHALKRGKIKADSQVAKRLYEKAMNGDTTAMIFWLKNRRPDRWRDRKEISGEINEKVKLSFEYDLGIEENGE